MADKRKITYSSQEIEELEEQIKLLIREQQTLNRRTASLQRRNIRLQELNKLKDEFIAVASHQLRTPATAVKQYISLVLGGYVEPLTESQKIFLEKAEDSNNRQLRIIDDLLQVARIDSESFKLNISRVDISELLHVTIEDMKNKLSAKNQAIFYLRPRRKMWVNGDSERLRMIFENIIENASNYSVEDTTIEVRVKSAKGEVVIDIIDHGVGISRPDIPKLFQKFSRIPNALSVEAGGTGLGLYWARKMTRMHGGSIKVKSQPDVGSTFTVTLPLALD